MSVSLIFCLFFASRNRHTICALVTGVQTCALPILPRIERNIALDQAARVRLAERQGTWLPRRASGPAHNVSAIHLSRATTGFTEIVRLDATSLPFCCGGLYESQRCIGVEP